MYDYTEEELEALNDEVREEILTETLNYEDIFN